MRIRPVSIIVVALLFVAGLQPARSAPETSADSANSRKPDHRAAWVTRQKSFTIPFSVRVADNRPAVVELYVSSDQGANWRLYTQQPTSLNQFRFQADEPGEYWFASRTVPTDRPPLAAKDQQVELKVIIDVDQPELDFEAKLGPAGDVVTTFQASDNTLDATSLKVEYQSSLGEHWKEVAIDRQRMKVTARSVAGRMSWQPETSAAALQVRAEVTDRAGNKSVVNRLVLRPNQQATAGADRTAGLPSDPLRKFAQNGVVWPDNNRLPGSLPTPGDRREQYVTTEAAKPAPPPVDAMRYPTTTPARAISSGPVARQLPQDQPQTMRRVPSVGPELSSPARMTRSRRFQLDYAIEAAGPSGVRKVELWGTSDRGATWSVWKLDEDRTSPVDVEVDHEGIFGFRVIVVANNGLAGAAPRNGDPADLWVGVDGTVPATRILSAQYGDREHFGQLDIRWSAEDRWLTESPITLLYSDRPSGPWTTIRSGIANTGQHYWAVDPRVPEKIYLRIEARDRAGNVGTYQLDEPISTAGLIPKAHIRGIRPQ